MSRPRNAAAKAVTLPALSLIADHFHPSYRRPMTRFAYISLSLHSTRPDMRTKRPLTSTQKGFCGKSDMRHEGTASPATVQATATQKAERATIWALTNMSEVKIYERVMDIHHELRDRDEEKKI